MNHPENPVVEMDKVVVEVTKEHHIGQAQRAAKSLAHSLGLPQVSTYSIATAVSELASNIFFHAGGGSITLAGLRQNGKVGVQIVAKDKGPGITDVDLAMEDGFTTNGGLGGGLPGVKRLLDEFEITSSVGGGTRIAARKWEPCR